MGLIKEPKGVDFFVVKKSISEKEDKEFSLFLEEYKKRRDSKKAAAKRNKKAA